MEALNSAADLEISNERDGFDGVDDFRRDINLTRMMNSLGYRRLGWGGRNGGGKMSSMLLAGIDGRWVDGRWVDGGGWMVSVDVGKDMYIPIIDLFVSSSAWRRARLRLAEASDGSSDRVVLCSKGSRLTVSGSMERVIDDCDSSRGAQGGRDAE